MKKLFLLLTLMGMVATGCSKDDTDKGNDNKTEQPNEDEGGSEDNIPENIFFGLDKESVAISPDGGSVDVIVYSNYKWEISGTSDWCTPSVKSGDANEDGQKVTFSADAAYDDREATFWFRCADKQIKFVVSQKSNNVIIYYTSSNGEIVQPNDSSAFGATIISNTYIDGVGAIEFDVPITTIGSSAFAWCDSLTSVTIPNSVTTIGERAFEDCSSLTSVTIPDSVTTIGNYTFYSCDNLTSVTIGDSVTTIGDDAFEYCSSLQEFKGKFASEDGRCLIIDGTLNAFAPAGLTEYTIPDSVTTIGEEAFYDCESLTSVTIPDSVTTIESCAFYNCDSLTSVTIPDSVITIGEEAFYDCSNLTIVTIGDSVTTIGEEAFWGCTSLTSVTIPNSVTRIGDNVFACCCSLQEFNGKFASEDGRCLIIDGTLNAYAPAGLTEYTIPDSVTSIGSCAFIWCPSLTSVTIGDSVTSIGDYAFSYCNSLTIVTIGDSVTTIGEEAFYNCYSLTSVTIGDSVTTIGSMAFYECKSLTSVTIPDSVTSIGNEAFAFCCSLTSVTIPDSVTTIGEKAFYGCSSLTSVTIGDSVTSIGYEAFYECTSLTSVYCKPTTPSAALLYNGYWDAFYNNAPDRKIYVPMESVYNYKSAQGWSDYASAIVGYNF